MIARVVWGLVVFIIIFGSVFVASFGVKIQKAFYEKTEIIVAEDLRDVNY